MIYFTKTKYFSVLTNGETELELYGGKDYCHFNPGDHIYGQDGNGNIYIDGKPAHIEVRTVEEEQE